MKLKIFLPFQKDLNPYLEEITTCSTHSWVYSNFKNFDPSFDLVNIHWPEALFDWQEPTELQLQELEYEISIWKNTSLIIYTKHDYERNKGMTPAFSRLFKIIESGTDVFIHLGNFSKEYYKNKFPQAKHKVIYHPLYRNTYKVEKKEMARKKLGIKPKATVIIAPGNIRNFKERDLILNSFKDIKEENKVLIVPNMRAELRFDFPGRIRLKRFFNLKSYFINRFKRKYSASNYIFNYNQLTSEELSVRMSAADIVLVPRQNILNSGIVFLGLTFNKILVGPAIGNIREQLIDRGMPIFEPFSRSSVTKAIAEGIKIYEKDDLDYQNKISKYEPAYVAQQMDEFFKLLKL